MKRELPDGHTVRYTHYRLVELAADPANYETLDKYLEDNFHVTRLTDEVRKLVSDDEARVLEWGGETLATVRDPDGEIVARASAYCNLTDQFNKKLGRIISLGRALKDLEQRVQVNTEENDE